MRKRQYTQCVDQPFVSDYVVEIIEEYQRDVRRRTDDTSIDPKPSGPSSQRPVPTATIHNLVGTARVEMHDTQLDLPSVSMHMPNGVFDRQKFAAITIRLHDPKCTVLLFSSGKMVLTGCKTFLQCLCASHDIVRIIRRAYPQTRIALSGVSIQNIVGNADLALQPNERIDLDGLMEDHNVYCTYLKHMFPGLIFRPANSPVVLLLFLSGKVVITGGKSSHDVSFGWKKLWPIIRQYIRPAA